MVELEPRMLKVMGFSPTQAEIFLERLAAQVVELQPRMLKVTGFSPTQADIFSERLLPWDLVCMCLPCLVCLSCKEGGREGEREVRGCMLHT